MARKFADIAVSQSVKATQTHYGIRAEAGKLDCDEMSGERLCEIAAEFIETRDGFY